MPGTITRHYLQEANVPESTDGQFSGDMAPAGNAHNYGSAQSDTQGGETTGLHDQENYQSMPSVPPPFSHSSVPNFAADEPADAPESNTLFSTSFPPPASPHLPVTPNNEMILRDLHNQDHLEIVVPQDTVILRGVGQNYEPALLQGTVVLNLPEATNIREITLSFYGKARVPVGEA
jgi:hypothetical protein